MKVKLIFLANILISITAMARLGYTTSQCDRKYGEWKEAVADNVRLYNVGGMEVACSFLDGECEKIRYCYGKNEPKKSEVQDLLDKNGGADRWVQYETYKWRSRSKTTPKWAELYLYQENIYLSISTDTHEKWLREKIKKEEKERKDRSDDL